MVCFAWLIICLRYKKSSICQGVDFGCTFHCQSPAAGWLNLAWFCAGSRKVR